MYTLPTPDCVPFVRFPNFTENCRIVYEYEECDITRLDSFFFVIGI